MKDRRGDESFDNRTRLSTLLGLSQSCCLPSIPIGLGSNSLPLTSRSFPFTSAYVQKLSLTFGSFRFTFAYLRKLPLHFRLTGEASAYLRKLPLHFRFPLEASAALPLTSRSFCFISAYLCFTSLTSATFASLPLTSGSHCFTAAYLQKFLPHFHRCLGPPEYIRTPASVGPPGLGYRAPTDEGRGYGLHGQDTYSTYTLMSRAAALLKDVCYRCKSAGRLWPPDSSASKPSGGGCREATLGAHREVCRGAGQDVRGAISSSGGDEVHSDGSFG
jgi:hypothetical protein